MVQQCSLKEIARLVKRKDITVLSSSLVIRFKWTKTLQSGGRLLSIPLAAVPRFLLCPVAAYTRMVELVPVPDGFPAFVLHNGVAFLPVMHSFFQFVLKSLAADCGVESSKLSSHSFRRGGATFAFNSGLPQDLIQLQGDWKSDCYRGYLVSDFTAREKFSQLMARSVSLNS